MPVHPGRQEDEPPQTQAAAHAHTAFFFDFLAPQGEGEEPAQRQAIQAEMLNVRTAWYRAGEERELEAIYTVAPILHGFHSAQSWFRDGIDDFRHVLDALPQGADLAQTPAQVRFDLLGRVGRMHLQIGQRHRTIPTARPPPSLTPGGSRERWGTWQRPRRCYRKVCL